MGEDLQSQPDHVAAPAQTKIKKDYPQVILLVLGSLVVIGGAFYAGIKYWEKQGCQFSAKAPTPLILQQPTEFLEPTSPTATKTSEVWRKWEKSAVINFEYPNGWHVHSGWPYNNEEPIKIRINPEPIDDAPQGGWDSVIIIYDYSGINNPEEILKKNIEEAKKNVSSLKETPLTINSTTFYKIEGESNLFNQTVPVLEYHALLRGPNTDNINTHVIRAQLNYPNNEEEYKTDVEIFERIVQSLRHKDQ